MNGWSLPRVTNNPCAKPSTMETPNTMAAANGQAQCHSVNAIASNTPVSAHMEPTDKSIPPVMMTRPRPRLNTP